MSLFEGSGVALITPFKKHTNAIDFDAMKKMLEFQIENKTDALIICGTTGEASTLTDDEQVECVRFAVAETKKRVPVIAGAGSNDTAHGITLTKRCAQAGADGILSVTPYYNKTTQKGLIEHFRLIAQSVDLPIIIYSVPSRTGLNITPKAAQSLSQIENITAIKEASGNITQIAEIAALCGDDLEIYSGNDDQIVPILSLGGKGVISVLANICPADTHEMVMSFLQGDIKKSTELQLRYMELVKAIFCEVNPIPVKTALHMMNYCEEAFRAPLTEMDDDNKVYLQSVLKNYNLI